jgi:hypothetical protein
MKIKLRPLSELTGDNYYRRVLMIRRDQARGCVSSAYMGTMAGVEAVAGWGKLSVPKPDGWVDPIEIEEDGEDDFIDKGDCVECGKENIWLNPDGICRQCKQKQ